MQVAVVQKLVESFDVDQLTDAENTLLQDEELPFEIEGEDDGQILEHIEVAVWIIEKMESHDLSFSKALEEYPKG